MSYYNKYNFISPEATYAIVKEELKSYFDTGAVDDLLFPTYLNKCLDKLGKATHAIVPVILFIEDFTCRLPDNFHAVREAWVCTQTGGGSYTSPEAFYTQVETLTTTQLAPLVTNEAPDYNCDDPLDPACLSSMIQAVYKVTKDIPRGAVNRKYLLKPGNISFNEDCAYFYNDNGDMYGKAGSAGPETPSSGAFDSFDLRDNKFVTTFRTGIVELIMYADDYDCLGGQLIPDNYRIKEFIELFIKYKVFEVLSNQTNDETFNQIQLKKNEYKALADESYILAETEIKKQNAYDKIRRIKKLKNRFNKYELPTGFRGRSRNN
jgi:hypothetical protein